MVKLAWLLFAVLTFNFNCFSHYLTYFIALIDAYWQINIFQSNHCKNVNDWNL